MITSAAIVYDRPRMFGAGVVKARGETDSLQRLLLVTVHHLGKLDTKGLVQGRHDVDGMTVLTAVSPSRPDTGRP